MSKPTTVLVKASTVRQFVGAIDHLDTVIGEWENLDSKMASLQSGNLKTSTLSRALKASVKIQTILKAHGFTFKAGKVIVAKPRLAKKKATKKVSAK